MSFMPNFIMKRPHVAEHDFTGVVVDANDTQETPGQAVWGFIPVGAPSFPASSTQPLNFPLCRTENQDETRLAHAVCARAGDTHRPPCTLA